MRAILFHNPTAGWGKFTKKELMTALRLGGLTPHYCSTKGRRFKKTLHQPADLVVVAGGDGTVTKVIAQMPDLRIPVAILPLGSANNIARSFGVAGRPMSSPKCSIRSIGRSSASAWLAVPGAGAGSSRRSG